MEEKRLLEAQNAQADIQLQSKKMERELARVKSQFEESDKECTELRRKVRELEREIKRLTFGK